MTLDPAALAQLPFVAFLIVVGGGVFTLLATGKLRWDREIKVAEAAQAKAEAGEADWKAKATKMVEVNDVQGQQIKSLTESVATLTRILQANKAGA